MDTLVLAARVALSLAAVLGVLWFLQRRVSRSGRVTRAASAVSVVTRQGIAPKASVVVVDVEGTRYLLGVTEQSVTLLSSGEAPVAPAALPVVPSATPVAEQDAVRPTRLGVDAFAQALHAESAATTTTATVLVPARDEEGDSLPLRRPRDRASRSGAARAGVAASTAATPPLPGSVLAGSILSGATWRQAAAALRQRRAG